MLTRTILQPCAASRASAFPFLHTRPAACASTGHSSLLVPSTRHAFASSIAQVSVGGQLGRSYRQELVGRAFGGDQGSNKDSSMDDYVEVKVDSVRVSSGASVVFLRLCATPGLVLPVHIGEAESSALLKEINKQKGIRPLTHDLTKHLLQAAGFRVTKIRITELVSSTYYSRIHIRAGSQGPEVDVDARPSDAINLAVRFDAPMYISKRIAENATAYPSESFSHATESHAEIVRSVRETLASFEDPTTMLQLQKELAVQEERYSDAQMFQQQIFEEMTHSVMLRLVVAMEAALADGRYEEAARVRDEYKRLVVIQTADSAANKY